MENNMSFRLIFMKRLMKDIDQTALSVLSLNQNFLETLQNSLYIYIYL